MALEQPFGVQALSYSGEQERRGTFGFLLARGATIGSVAGGVVNLAAGDFIATAPASGMSVNNAAGEAVVPGSTSTTQSGYPTRGSSTTNSAIAAANATLARIDGVYLQINDANYAGLTNSAVITVVTGTPTYGATLANLLGAGAAPVSSMLINYVGVPPAATSIIAGDLGDHRVQVKASSAIASGNVVTGVSTNTAMVSGTSYIVSSLSPTMTLPVPAIGAWVVVTNYGSGIPVVSHNASEVIWGLGLGSSGSASFSLGTYGATATVESDGTSWYITAGNVDSGWIAVTYTSPWVTTGNISGAQVMQYRKQGNAVRLRGAVSGGTTGSVICTIPAGYVPSDAALAAFAIPADIGGISFAWLEVSTGSGTVGQVVPNFSGSATYLLIDVSWTVD